LPAKKQGSSYSFQFAQPDSLSAAVAKNKCDQGKFAQILCMHVAYQLNFEFPFINTVRAYVIASIMRHFTQRLKTDHVVKVTVKIRQMSAVSLIVFRMAA